MRLNKTGGLSAGKAFLICAAVLVVVLAALFHKSIDPDQVLFANDGPLGAMKASMNALPETFSGTWQDLNWIGGESPSAAPDISAGLAALVPGEIFLKIFAPLTLLILGLSVWLCFRELGFNPLVCVLGGLAAGLNMHAFSLACWGLGTWINALAMMFLAIAALVSRSIPNAWMRGALAGVAVGIGLMEGFDVGAILSVYVGVFGLFAGLVGQKITGKTVGRTVAVMAIVVAMSAITAAHTISTLVGTQVANVAVAKADERTKEERWIWATQWSLPKLETLRVIIPGLFGYRMDTEGTGQLYKKSYWGAVAQSPEFKERLGDPNYRGLARHSGSGEYAGIFVVLVGAFALAQSFRKENSPFTALEKKFVWFWGAAALFSLLMAFGRHAPLYRLAFELPGVSTIRNPIKFMHAFHACALILFGYGLESLFRRYLSPATAAQTKTATTPSSLFEKRWIIVTGALAGLSALGWMVYASSKRGIVAYLNKYGLGVQGPEIPLQIADFSIGEVGWFVLFFGASVALVIGIMRGKFVGKTIRAGVLAGTLIVADLAHADVHWIVYQNFKAKYASNPIVDFLREKPYEQRVSMFQFQVNQELSFLQQIHYVEWLQHLYPFYDVQSLDVAQEPRVSSDNQAYRQAFQKLGAVGQTRLWQLTNVRYVLGLGTEFVEAILNNQFDPEKRRFRPVAFFTFGRNNATGSYLVETNNSGPFALIEFTGALPRAKLYNSWTVLTNDAATLEKLADPAFDPTETVLVAKEISAKPTGTNAESGSVEIVSYQPKQIQLRARATAPSVLLLNDKYDAKWKVTVDGQEKPLLRCNYIMRGVQLEPGEHLIEFYFRPPLTMLYTSLAGLGAGFVILMVACFGKKRTATKTVPPPANS